MSSIRNLYPHPSSLVYYSTTVLTGASHEPDERGNSGAGPTLHELEKEHVFRLPRGKTAADSERLAKMLV
jgi:hypothetical protein